MPGKNVYKVSLFVDSREATFSPMNSTIFRVHQTPRHRLSKNSCWRSQEEKRQNAWGSFSEFKRFLNECLGMKNVVSILVWISKWTKRLTFGTGNHLLGVGSIERLTSFFNLFWSISRHVIDSRCKLNRLEKKYTGIVNMTSYPDICIFVDEANKWNLILNLNVGGTKKCTLLYEQIW